MVSVAAEGLRHDLLELGFDLIDVLAGREASAVADAEDVGVDGEGFLPEGSVKDHVGRLAADAWEFLKLFAGTRDFAAVVVDQGSTECDDVFGLGVEQPDGFDGVS